MPRLSPRLFLPAANQNIRSPTLWQDPVLGYFESHGKMEFKTDEHYNLSDEQKKAVLFRYRVKEVLKKEFLRREFDPRTFRYKDGIVIDPAVFRWYAADMTQAEFFRVTPKSVFLYVGASLLILLLVFRSSMEMMEGSYEKQANGEVLWWDRQNGRMVTSASNGKFAYRSDYG